MSKYNRPCRLKKEARPFFEEKLAERILSFDQWHNYYHMDENALEEVQEVYITYGNKRYSKYSTSGVYDDLGGWANPDNDEFKKNGEAGGKFCFTIHFPSMKFEEHDKFSKGRLIAGLMDRIQQVADRYFEQFASGEIDDIGNEKKEMNYDHYYIITAINRQTGLREPISSPRCYSVAYRMLLKKQSGKRGALPRKYMNPRLEEYPP